MVNKIKKLSLIEPENSQQGFNKKIEELGIQPSTAWPDMFGKHLQEWARTKVPSIKVLSLFSGAGGLDIGFHDCGFIIKTKVEIDKRFVQSLQANSVEGGYYGAGQITPTDINDFVPTAEVDFIIGGPPCQTFSAAGRRVEGVKGLSDERGMLFKQYVRLLKELKPRGFLFENVYGILGAQKGEAWQTILSEFNSIGYSIYFRILDAADFGVPQHRERLFVVGLRKGTYFFPQPTHGPDSPAQQQFYTAKEALHGATLSNKEQVIGVNGRYGTLLNDIPPGLNYSYYTEKMGHPFPVFAWRSKFSDFLYKADPDTPVRTIKAQGGQYTGPFHWENRPFGINELKRLQTFPDEYSIIGNRQVAVMQIGNSVPPQLSRILALSILKQVYGITPPIHLPSLNEGQVLGFRKRKRLLTNRYRKKAAAAIKQIIHKPGSQKESRVYRAGLTEKFEWNMEPNTKGNFQNFTIEVQWTPKKLIIKSLALPKIRKNYEININPKIKDAWSLPVDSVQLVGDAGQGYGLTAIWKAFEYELITNNIKADLVQLSGYYQYEPAIKIYVDLLDPIEDLESIILLKWVTQGSCVGRLLSEKSIADTWGVNKKELISIVKNMKRYGFEVRNNNTNPQIPEGHFLIPYSFPTLQPLSVQLNKKLY